MIRLTASLLLGFLMTSAALADPISIFIRAGKKTHAPGAHEHEQFLQDWKPLLEARGARVTGGMEFPTAEQLKGVDVLILHAQEAGNIALGAERKALLDFLKRGGGLVVLHAGAVSRDPTWYRSIIGGSWNHSTPTQWLEAPMALYFTDRSNPITQDISNFDLDDEIYYDMDILPEAHILAAAYTPKAIDTGGRGNKEAQERAAEAVKLKKGVNIYDIQPQIWTYENRIDGAQRDYRAFVSIPGHWYRNFSHLGVRTLILRGIAWAAGRENVDELCQPEELGDALRYVEGGAPRPQDLPAQLEVHPDFELSLVASEPLINNPMNVTWDEKGRLWVVESPEYPNGLREANVETWKDSGSLQPGQYQREPQDRVSILRDEDGDGVMDAKTVFADQIELATSLALYRNGVIVCAAPNIWFFEDTDGDDVADRRTKLYSNLGDRDTHAVINNLRWGRDGWIYATHGYSATSDVLSGDGQRSFGPAGSGVVRFKPDGSAFEQYASRGGNTWGLDLTTGGEVFYTQPTTGNPLVHVMLPEPILAEGKLPGVDGTVGLLPGEATFPAMEWQHQAYVQIDQVGRYTAGAGCAIYEGGAWPDSWNFSYFVGEPTLNIVGQYFVTPDGSGFQAHKEADRANTEFIRSRNMWFRPIDTRIGPDGALYITDFCNQAVIHNDTRGPTHGPANAAVRPDRDHYYGRIWRVQHRQAQSLPRLALDRKDIAGLEKAAASSANGTVKDIARRLLREETGAPGERVGSAAVRAYDAARQETDAEKILAQVRSAPDDWILSALVAAAAPRAGEVIAAALSAPVSQPVSRFATALVPAALAHDEAAAATLVRACAEAKGEAALRREVLTAIASGSASKHAPDAATQTALAQLLQEPETVTPALSLFSQWGLAATMAEPVKAVTTRLQATLADASAPLDQRTRAASSLVAVGGAAADSALVLLGEAQQPEPLHRALIDAADRTGHAELIVSHYAALPAPMQRPAFEAILRRPPATEALLTALEAGSIPTDSFAPGDVARLRSHPNKLIARRADRIFQVNLAAKDAIISSLIPEVEKPGDADKGQILFAACAVCCTATGVRAVAASASASDAARPAPDEKANRGKRVWRVISS